DERNDEIEGAIAVDVAHRREPAAERKLGAGRERSVAVPECLGEIPIAIEDDQVRPAVPVEIDGQGEAGFGSGGPRRAEGPVAVAREEPGPHAGAREDVGPAVAVEVADGDDGGRRVREGQLEFGLEAAAAVAEEDEVPNRKRVVHDDVEPAVAVQVSDVP